jgi:hypothetical protein
MQRLACYLRPASNEAILVITRAYMQGAAYSTLIDGSITKVPCLRKPGIQPRAVIFPIVGNPYAV